ncbi:hypothetical protein NNJEOMEG_01226 [Fundidesulfovibrio magnetotacticus]|uniref:Transcriptional regulator n=1 Tax=Fundidesulfovibrio magnetotacticus TaxID=2730080 RepID=A0A6V8LNW6_9BACT|nr:YafY family protein [Fundidesulfovibrio magnetotacticus]GFK93394.1 hypothetical protein NNJEOMEG_01226 [Fundidesulfovibrio magnetotacticus]
MSRSARLLTLLQLLRGRSRPATARFLAGELGVSERTLYRYVADLTAQGAPIQGEAGQGYMLRPGYFLPPLMFTREELEAVLLGLETVDRLGDPLLAGAASRALAKVEAVLPPSGLDVLRNPSVLPGPRGPGFPEGRVGLDRWRAAIRDQEKVRIAYEDAQGLRSERVVWPLALGFLDQARVVAAWCELRGDVRTFRTDRVLDARPTGETYPGRRGALLKAWRERMTDAERS